MIWCPSAGGGPLDGYRYRSSLRLLDVPEVQESCDEALALVEALAVDQRTELHDWAGHGPALSAYAMWSVYALRDHGVITEAESKPKLKRLAKLQQKDGLYPGYPGIHYGRSTGWLAPPWWGSEIHEAHRQLLAVRAPGRYPVGSMNPEPPRLLL